MDVTHLWHAARPFLLHDAWPFVWQFVKLLAFLAVSLFIANLIEVLNWSRFLSRIFRPLIRAGHMKDVVGASFSVSFFSGMTGNTMLAEAFAQGDLSQRELVLANLFNSLPTYFVHLPTTISISLPFLGTSVAATYLGLTFGAAILRTFCVILAGRFLLPSPAEVSSSSRLPVKGITWREALAKSWKRFKRRIVKICLITAPIFAGVELLNAYGFFRAAERWMNTHAGFLSWISPKEITIVIFGMAAEFTKSQAAAGALLHSGDIPAKNVVLALLVANILATPVRAFRHQFPYYAGIFRPAVAGKLLTYSQAFRVGSVLFMTMLYAWLG